MQHGKGGNSQGAQGMQGKVQLSENTNVMMVDKNHWVHKLGGFQHRQVMARVKDAQNNVKYNIRDCLWQFVN